MPDSMEMEVGARIRRLRKAAGLRGSDLANLVELDSTVISKIETGQRSLKSTELTRIAMALQVSPLALIEDNALLSEMPIAARRAGSSIGKGKAYERLLSLAELHVLLADAGIPTSPNLFGVPSIENLGWLDGANCLADWATNELALEGVQGDHRLAVLAQKIESQLSVDVLIDEFPNDPLSGAAITDRSFPLLFVNSSHSRTRSLFTLAHELGHLLAGHSGGTVLLDRELAGSNEEERLANAFAASYLLPETDISSSLNESGRYLSTLVNIAAAHGVGYETLVYRLHNLRQIDAEVRDRLMSMSWQGLIKQSMPTLLASGKTQNEIGGLLGRSELKPAGRHPALLLRRAFEGFRKGIVSVRPLSGLLKVDAAELLTQLSGESDFPSVSKMFSEAPVVLPEQAETDEELFSGSPV